MKIIPETVYLEGYLEYLESSNLNDETVLITEGPFEGKEDFIIGQKTHHINQAKKISSTVLSYTDWYISRKVERGIDIPQEISSYRQEVLDTFEQHKQMISSVTTEEELKNLYVYSFIVEGQPESRRPLPEWPRM